MDEGMRGEISLPTRGGAFPETLLDDDYNQSENHEHNGQPNCNPKQRFFNSTPRGEDAAGIGAGQPAEADTFTLQYNTGDQGNCRYNQCDIEISFHDLPPEIETEVKLYLLYREIVNERYRDQ
jgi:hypothetical protein